MAGVHPLREELVAWIEGGMGTERAEQMEHHVDTCGECRGFVEFIRAFGHALETAPLIPHPDEKCPPIEVLLRYIYGELDEDDEETARHIRAHLFMCDGCFQIIQQLEDVAVPAIIPFSTALDRYLKEFEKQPLSIAARPAMKGIVIDRERETREFITFKIILQPRLTPAGHLTLALELPHDERLRGRPAEVILLVQGQQYNLTNTTHDFDIVVDHELDPVIDIQVTPNNLGQALAEILTVSVYI